ncbi:MAG: glycosyltransferase family 4 protein [Flavobacterium sp.]|nr:glycosyltransferase family 4 protein [Flavobacterium sp.]
MKKVLIVTYYFPPAGGPGVQRWLKFVKYLPDFQIEPIVYIPQNPTYPIEDEGLLSDVSDQLTILKQPIWEPYGLASLFSKKNIKNISAGIIPTIQKQSWKERLALFVRGNLFIPDARVFWVKPSVAYLKDYCQANDIDTIITTGPPHSLHLIGLALQQQVGIKWVADFRDPWTTIGYHKALKLLPWAQRKHKRLEKEVLQAADAIIVTSATTKTEFESLTSRPITVITNGYDTTTEPSLQLDAKFSLAHIGSLLSARNPIVLWEALFELLKEVPELAQHLQLKFIGTTSQEVKDTLEKLGLLTYVRDYGYVSHHEAVKHQKESQVLLLIEIDSPETKLILPGKLFEYLVSGRPILAMGPAGSDFASIIQETQSGSFFTYDQKMAVKNYISSCFTAYKKDSLKSTVVGVEKYARKNLTQQLAQLLTTL